MIFFIYERIEMKQTANVKWSKLQSISVNHIQINYAISEMRIAFLKPTYKSLTYIVSIVSTSTYSATAKTY